MYLQFKNVQKTYDQTHLVVKDFNLNVERGEFITLLGPSGSGKTTVLMMLAGFEPLSNGRILLDGQPIERIPAYQRNIGMVFQNYALFPHMTVAENLAYPLKLRRWPKKRIQDRVHDFLSLIDMAAFAHRKPAALSGGQRQRVALARALIFEPALVLMDEPLGALDKNLREHMQLEIQRLHEQLGFSVIYVTHDQQEALILSDKIAVFHQGVVQQFDTPTKLYNQPNNAFVAAFIGENNMVPLSHLRLSPPQTVHAVLADHIPITAQNGNCHQPSATGILAIRPEKIQVNPHTHTDNQCAATFITEQYGGDCIRYFFALASGQQLSVKCITPLPPTLTQKGQQVILGWNHHDCFAFLN